MHIRKTRAPRRLPLAALLAAGAIGALVGPAAARVPCAFKPCVATLRVGAVAAKWTSPELFRRSQTLDVSLEVGGRALKGSSVNQCVAQFYGGGLSVRFAVCGAKAPIKVRAANAGTHPVLLRIRYALSA